MVNLARSLFFGALFALALAAVTGRPAGMIAFGLLAAVALFAFTRLTREPIIPLARLGLSLTKAGWGAVFFVLFILVSAIQSGANLLFFLASAMIGCIAAALLYGPFALRKVSVTLQMPSWAFAGEEAVAAISVSNAKRFLPIIALRIEGDAEGKAALLAAVASLPARASAHVEFPFVPSGRGEVRSADVELSTVGPVGLVWRAVTVRLAAPTAIYPAPAQVDLPASARRPQERGRTSMAREGDFAGLRDWRPGDSPRHIHWRSSARVGRLVAKEFALIDRQEASIFLDTMGVEGEEFEAAVSRAAGFAVAAGRGGFKVRLTYFDTALRVVEDDGVGGLPHRALRALSGVRPQSATSLDAVLRMAGSEDRARAAVIEVRIGAPSAARHPAAAKEAADVS